LHFRAITSWVTVLGWSEQTTNIAPEIARSLRDLAVVVGLGYWF